MNNRLTGSDHSSEHHSNSKENHSVKTAKRIIAWIAIILLAGLYIMTFISALLARPGAGQLFRFCLGMTIAVPIFAWICIWAVGVLSHRHTIASMDLLNSNPDARKEMEDAVRNSQSKASNEKNRNSVGSTSEDSISKDNASPR